ncbi:MAG: PAS domain S-box protein, partial [Actinobacteria bacterium]|nr:PAS domain S-box protein [Actinomycetota bacterium]
MFGNMRVGWRLALGFSLVLAFMVAIIGVSLRQAQVSHAKLDHIVKRNNVRLQMANDMVGNARDTASITRGLILAAAFRSEHAKEISKLRESLAERRRSNAELAAAIKKLITEDDTKGFELLSKLEASEAASGQLQDQAIQLALEGRPVEASSLLFEKSVPAIEQRVSDAHAFVQHNEERTSMRYREADESAADARTTMLILGGLAIAFSVAIVVLVTKSITKPLNLSVNAANRVASGDLAVDLAMGEKRGDELGILMQSLSSMVAALRDNRDVMNRDITERERMDEELRAVSLYTRNLIEANLDPLMTISSDGKITDVNDATEQVTGVSRERLIGSDFADYFTEPEKARAGYEQVFSQDVVRDYPLTIRHASGRTTDVLYNASVYKNEAGAAQGVFAAARDITESKRLAEELREYAALKTGQTELADQMLG